MSIIPIIQAQDFSCRYDVEIPVLRGVSFAITAGENTALLGLNGAGKSTLLRALVGLVKGTGIIHILGQPVNKANLNRIRRQVGFLFQDPQVQLFCPTVIEDVAFGPLNIHSDLSRAHQEARTMLYAVGFNGNHFTPCHRLSLGEMRKVALAGVLACKPRILLLDEPDSYLDCDGKSKIIEILRDLDDITLIMATHDLEFARQICVREIFLERGRIRLTD